MRRRTYLRNVGLLASVGLAGCLDGQTPKAANKFGYPTTTTDDVAVPLAPLSDVFEWYQNDVGVFADTRSRMAYEKARIAGAVHSPAPDGLDNDDPLRDLDSDTRIITYCGCPHHLSTLRGATLIKNGYVNTYAIDEGFQAWYQAGYPLGGSAVEEQPTSITIDGRTNPAATNDLAWAWHDSTGQREAAPIAADGSFTLHVRFYDVTEESVIRLKTPFGEVTESLGALDNGVIEI